MTLEIEYHPRYHLTYADLDVQGALNIIEKNIGSYLFIFAFRFYTFQFYFADELQTVSTKTRNGAEG